MADYVTDSGRVDGSWELTIEVTDVQVEKKLRVNGELHIGGVMVKLVEALGMYSVWREEKSVWNTHSRILNNTIWMVDHLQYWAKFTQLTIHFLRILLFFYKLVKDIHSGNWMLKVMGCSYYCRKHTNDFPSSLRKFGQREKVYDDVMIKSQSNSRTSCLKLSITRKASLFREWWLSHWLSS